MSEADYVGGLRGRDFLTTQDFRRKELERILDAADDLKKKFKKGEPTNYCFGKTLFLLFYNRSLRTRNSFEAGIYQLGGNSNFLSPEDIYEPTLPEDMVPYKTESISDVSRILSMYGDALAIRVYGGSAKWIIGRGRKIIKEFARWSNVPTFNMEDDIYHPFQALADMQAVREAARKFEGKKFVVSYAYSGGLKPLAVPNSVTLIATHFGMDVTLAHPEGFYLKEEVIESARRNAEEQGGDFEMVHNMREVFGGAGFVYPKAWSPKEFFPPYNEKMDKKGARNLQGRYKDWIVDRDILAVTNDAYYMHCGPADRNQEVTDDVLDEYERSLYFEQAENRLHVQNAVMAMTMD